MGLFDDLKARGAVRKFEKTTLGKALAEHTKAYFYSGEVLSSISQERKQQLVEDLYAKVMDVLASPDGRSKLRNFLAEYLLMFAQLQVLCLTEGEKAEAFYAANPLISGELHRHIVEAAKHHKELAELAWQHENMSAEELIAFANKRSALMLYYLNGLNMVRIETGDRGAPKDWFLPFVEAMLVWEEDCLRERLLLPRLTSEPLHALAYSTYLNMVVDGEANPFFAWTQHHPDQYLHGVGPKPLMST